MPNDPTPDSGPPETWTTQSEPPAAEDRGSFALGFALGLFGGLVMVLILLRRGKPNHRVGATWGFAVQLALLGALYARTH